MLGAIGCALSPTIYFLIAARVVQGFGGGIAAAVARAVIVDVAHGTMLAKVMSVMQAIGGLAPMIAPVVGALVLTVANWRAVFWTLVIFGGLMVVTAAFNIPETLEPEPPPLRWPPTVAGGHRRGGTDPALPRVHAHQRLLRLRDDGLHRELLVRAAGS